jgi:C4-dicarboxylate-binding protein DctP
MGQNGFRNFTNNVRPIKTAADMKGLKVRVMEAPVYINMIRSLGAEPVPIAWPELYTSLETGVVHGQENPVSIIIRGTLYEVQRYVTLSGHVWSENSLIMNPQRFHGLPAEAQRIIRAAARQAIDADRVAETLMTMVLGMDYLEGGGRMEVHRLTPAARREFREITQPAVLEWLRDKIGAGEAVDGLLAAVEEAEKALGYR